MTVTYCELHKKHRWYIMKWELRKVKGGWGVFLVQEFCKTEEPVCYGITKHKKPAAQLMERLNNPIYEEKV